jgi:hypothetical protein
MTGKEQVNGWPCNPQGKGGHIPVPACSCMKPDINAQGMDPQIRCHY